MARKNRIVRTIAAVMLAMTALAGAASAQENAGSGASDRAVDGQRACRGGVSVVCV